jgi:hypothetical protein
VHAGDLPAHRNLNFNLMGVGGFRTYISFTASAIKKQWIYQAGTCTLKEKTGAVTSYPR